MEEDDVAGVCRVVPFLASASCWVSVLILFNAETSLVVIEVFSESNAKLVVVRFAIAVLSAAVAVARYAIASIVSQAVTPRALIRVSESAQPS